MTGAEFASICPEAEFYEAQTPDGDHMSRILNHVDGLDYVHCRGYSIPVTVINAMTFYQRQTFLLTVWTSAENRTREERLS